MDFMEVFTHGRIKQKIFASLFVRYKYRVSSQRLLSCYLRQNVMVRFVICTSSKYDTQIHTF